MKCYRITNKERKETAFDGEGAKTYGGRWNNKGTTIVYAAESRALAILELLVHIESEEFLQSEYLIFEVTVDDQFALSLNDSLPINWRDYPAPSATKRIGDQWIQQEASLILEVPSVIVPQENNFLINPEHPDFRMHAAISHPSPLDLDNRL